MDDVARALTFIGALLLAALLAEYVGRRTRLPRVTILLLIGVAAGPAALDLLPEDHEAWFPVVADIALVMIGFLLGSEFSRRRLKGQGRGVMVVTGVQAGMAALVVGVGLFAFGAGAELSLIMAGVATATAPAATIAVINEVKARGPFTDLLRRVVAVDDLFALTLFSVLAAAVSVISGEGSGFDLVLGAAREIGGAIGLGIALGLPASFLSGRIRPGEATLLEALGLILLCVGIAEWLELSPLLAAVVMGATIANFARHHTRAFHDIENIEWPFLALFFLLAGASLELDAVKDVGWIGVGYIVLRAAGKLVGANIGGRIGGAPANVRRWLGLALLPHAGVPLGLALVAADRFPEIADEVLAVTVVATVVFELAGPLLIRFALSRVGETAPAGR